jgi:uncharacterized protein (DUF1800 family)
MAQRLDPVLFKQVARAGIRASEDDKARLVKDGWAGWVDAQIAMPAEDSAKVQDVIKNAKLEIAYEAGDGYKALKEMRAFSSLSKPTRELWHLVDWDKKMPYEERIRPGQELIAATHIRAIHSDAQLLETVTDFWRDHFVVNRDSIEDVQISLPTYEQDILRRHAFGNFREFLEAVTKSTAMLAYLNNASSKASPANENFARELFELHTLGAPAYLHGQFGKWRDVPGALEGRAAGYIDEDVYEAARAFTGWSYEGGQWVADGVTLERTGEFKYVEHWHDPYQKRILGVEFESHTPPMEDGMRVLDMVAFHPATAHHVCYRICKRFVSDAPPADLVDSATRIFKEHAKSPDQLARVFKHVFMSEAFATAEGRLQRPLFLMASIFRQTDVSPAPSQDFTWLLNSMGHKLYGWQSPAGHPLSSGYWQSPGLLVRRWRGMNDLWQRVIEQKPDMNWANAAAFGAHWAENMTLPETHARQAAKILETEFGDASRAITFNKDERWTVSQALTYLSATPDFQAV